MVKKDDPSEVAMQAERAAMNDIDEILGNMDVSRELRQIILLGWMKGAHWGMAYGMDSAYVTTHESLDAILRKWKGQQ